MIFYNGTIVTLDRLVPQPDALGVRDGRIVSAGTLEEARAAVGGETEMVDLRGRTAIPGFNDDHIHVLGMGDYFSRPNLAGLDAPAIIDLLREMYAGAPAGRLLVANGWDYPSCPNPHRTILDQAFPDNPVALFQYSGHGVWVSSGLLAQMKISRTTKDPLGGKIVRDADGEPTGILFDAAARPLHLMRSRARERDSALQAQNLDRALALLRENGLTTVQDNTWIPQSATLFREYAESGKLTVRISCWADGRSESRRRRLERMRFDGTMLHLGPIKYFLDGTFSTKTAWLLAPYPDDPSNIGIPMGTGHWIDKILKRATVRKRQAAFHAIGDRAVHELVNAVERVSRTHPWIRELRMRVEHGQLIAPDDIPRIRDLGIVISAQPHALGTPEKDIGILGERRAVGAYPYRSLLDGGVHLAFGSDVPGESTFRPLLAIHNTVNRSSPERISAEEALRAYTAGSAFVEFAEGDKGTLSVGKYADITVLSANPLTVRQDAIRDIAVEMTVVGGRIVYDRSAAGGAAAGRAAGSSATGGTAAGGAR